MPEDLNGIALLLSGSHYDPHQLLGPHGDGKTTTIRVLKPGAEHVEVRIGSESVPLKRRAHDLFEGTFTFPPDTTYTLRVRYPQDFWTTEHDPYAFLPSVGDVDLYLFGEGRHRKLSEMMGARPHTDRDISGMAFSVWAPSAQAVSVVGDFNAWNPLSHPMRVLGNSGVWELFAPGVESGVVYKFSILGQEGHRHIKADPFAKHAEVPPLTGSKTWKSNYRWHDNEWLERRRESHAWSAPMSVYEIHLDSWRKGLDYSELAEQLADYVKKLGFTHVEFMPVMEHPFSGSWGYQVTGFYAPTSRFGDPDAFKALIDHLHVKGIGVILDWVPAHFPRDIWALAQFDGSALFEHADPRRGSHPDWGTLVFNHGRNEVRNFLIGSALEWLGEYHCDGLRVDAVASMLYLDYSRKHNEWVPNKYGGREDLEALGFIRELNTVVYAEHPDVLMIAEESTAWPGVSRPVSDGGLGFGFKWNMGWMHDILEYFAHEPIHRRYHHNDLTFSAVYAFTENFVLPLSHDEVVHGKRSLVSKMPGDKWQRLANLRALYGFMWAHPGKKLLFMGSEFAQENEWNHEQSLDWHLCDDDQHANVARLVRDLNEIYRDDPALFELDHEPGGFGWIEADDADSNVVAFHRSTRDRSRQLVCISNLSPVPREHYRLGLPIAGHWREVINTDSGFYGGSNVGNAGGVDTEPIGWNRNTQSAVLTLPPLGTVWLAPQ